MPVSLENIVAATRVRIGEAKKTNDLRELQLHAKQHVPRGFAQRLGSVASSGIAIIAELKKASPSRGVIRSEFDVAHLAQKLQQAGAAALSVLTEAEFFQGSLHNLQLASSSATLPCLRKDFIVDEFQILEARANGADAVLLITAVLSQAELVGLLKTAREQQLDVLCEVHSEEELSRALDAGCNFIGVNSRDLRTFSVDLETAFRLAELIPGDVLAVAESGIHSGADIARLRSCGYDAFLIGESLMRSEHPGEMLKNLLLQAATPVAAF